MVMVIAANRRAPYTALVVEARPRLAGTSSQRGAGLIGRVVDRATQALPGVNSGVVCQGCGRAFTPDRATQRHCRAGCRILSYRKRKEEPSLVDLLASGIGAGHVDPEVVS
jgi:hypothetical protein